MGHDPRAVQVDYGSIDGSPNISSVTLRDKFAEPFIQPEHIPIRIGKRRVSLQFAYSDEKTEMSVSELGPSDKRYTITIDSLSEKKKTVALLYLIGCVIHNGD